MKTIASISGEHMFGYLSLDIICSFKLKVFSLAFRSRNTVRFSVQIMCVDKYPSIFSRQKAGIVYIYSNISEGTAFLLLNKKAVPPVTLQYISLYIKISVVNFCVLLNLSLIRSYITRGFGSSISSRLIYPYKPKSALLIWVYCSSYR